MSKCIPDLEKIVSTESFGDNKTAYLSVGKTEFSIDYKVDLEDIYIDIYYIFPDLYKCFSGLYEWI